jgi:aminocarboxymuconate-semialdehyde decarboxylase
MLRYVTEVIPEGQIMLGSDSPFPLGEPHPVTFVRNALPAAQAELVLSGNFERLIGG